MELLTARLDHIEDRLDRQAEPLREETLASAIRSATSGFGFIDLFPLLTSLVAASVAVGIYLKQSRLTRQLAGGSLVNTLCERFEAQRMVEKRRRAARDLQDAAASAASKAASDVLDFFTIIAFMVKSEALDENPVYIHFEYYILNYWYYSKQLVSTERAKDAESWRTLEILVEQLKSEKGTRGGFRPDPAFLSIESALTELSGGVPIAH